MPDSALVEKRVSRVINVCAVKQLGNDNLTPG